MNAFKAIGVCTLLLTASAVTRAEIKGVEIQFKPYAIAGLRIVEMSIDGTAGQFIFDTGGGLTLITPEFSSSLGLKHFGRLTGFRHTGELIHFPRFPAHTITIGGVRMQQSDLALFDLMKLLEGAPILQGIVALDMFDGAAMTIDFAQNRLILETEESLKTRTREMVPLRIRAARGSGGASLDVFVAVDSQQGTLWLELDSGNAGPVLLSPHAAEQLGLKTEEKPAAITLRLSPTTDYMCTALIKETIYDGLLNAAFFNQNVVTLDLRRMQAWVLRNK